jgi:general secretion pathway protein D
MCFLAACTLPYDQLQLPSGINPGANGGATGSLNPPRTGVPLGNDAYPGTEQARVFPGTGQFTAANGAQQPGRAAGVVTGDGITLDLANASIAEASRTVLGEMLGVNYVVSDKVSGQVTLKTSKPVGKQGLLEIFETVLAAQGAAIVANGDVFSVVPLSEALAAGKPIRSPASTGPRGPGVSHEVVALQYVSAAEMERILKSVSATSSVARVDSDRNLLILTGNATELASLVETIRVFDVDWMRGMSFGIFPIETADPAAIAQELDTIFANDRDGPAKGVIRFVPNARLKAVLVISSRPDYLRKAETWINRIDLAGRATERSAYVYHVKYRPATELAQVLQKLYAPRKGQGTKEAGAFEGATNGIETSSTGAASAQSGGAPGLTAGAAGGAATQGPQVPVVVAPGAPGTGLPQAQGQQQGLPAPLDGETLLPPGVVAGAAAQQGSLTVPPADDINSGISIIADETNNSVVVSATAAEIKRIRRVLSEIDVMPAQVLLEATIAEVTLNDQLRFGLRWFFRAGLSRFKFTDAAPGTVKGEDKSPLASVAPIIPGFSYFLNIPNAQLVVNALADITNVDVVSSPSLMVLNNKKAILQIGDEVPIATQSAVAVTAPDAPIVNAITFRNTGVILNITPRISDDNNIILEIEQEVSDVKPTTSSTIDSPTIQQRRIKTVVSVPNGESIVLAGLMQDRSTRERGQVPIAGDIPLIGNLFKNKEDTVARTELLIAITPHVVKDSRQIDMIAAEFRDRLNLTTRPQREAPPDRREQVDRLVR